jgi:hypothetical protein
MVKEICLFYVKKCSGRYEDNKAAARYVHQMSQEIITQLSGVAGEIKRNKGEPELYQALLDEWNENFPPALGAMGSPKAIASLVASQSSEIEDLRHALEGEVSKREKDVTEILRSMDAQLQAYKSSVISERRHQHLVENQLREDHEIAIAEEQRKRKEDLERVVRVQAREAKTHALQVEERLRDGETVISRLTEQLEDNVRRQTADVEAVVRGKDKRINKLSEKYDKLKGQYMELVSHLNEELEGDLSVLSMDSSSDVDDDTISSEGTVSQEGRMHEEKRETREEGRKAKELKEVDRVQKMEAKGEREAAREVRRAKKETLLEKLKSSKVDTVGGIGGIGGIGGMGMGGIGGEAKAPSVKGSFMERSQGSEVYKSLKAQVEKVSKECADAREKAEVCAKRVATLSRENDLYKK